MKVLTIKEPYASIIMSGLKEYETRSWKTNYRGKIYIHASIKIDDDLKSRKDLQKLVYDNNITLKPGYILCEAYLDDCIYMNDMFIKNVSDKEKMVGRYELGRYAWHLSDIRVIEPVQAKGKLGIWNYEFDVKYIRRKKWVFQK